MSTRRWERDALALLRGDIITMVVQFAECSRLDAGLFQLRRCRRSCGYAAGLAVRDC